MLDRTRSEHSVETWYGDYHSVFFSGFRRVGRVIVREQVVIRKVVRALVGAAILCVVLFSILVPHMLPVSGKSIVNAKLEWVRSPIVGNVFFSDIEVGQLVEENMVLGRITNERADDSYLNHLRFEMSVLKSSLQALGEKREDLHRKQLALESMVETSLSIRKQQTLSDISSSKTAFTAAKHEQQLLEKSLLRYKKANKKFSADRDFSVVSRSVIESAQNRLNDVSASVVEHRSTLHMAISKYASVINGASGNEAVPHEQLQLNETRRSLAQLLAEEKQYETRLKKMVLESDKRVLHLEKISSHEIIARERGVLWDVGFAEGSYVHNGDPLLAIADTNSLLIECIFHQRYLDDITVGDSATIDLMGSEIKLTGKVKEMKIRGLVKSADLNTFNFISPASNEFKVIVEIDEDQKSIPHIGQRAKVVITKSEKSIAPSLFLFFSR